MKSLIFLDKERILLDLSQSIEKILSRIVQISLLQLISLKS